MHAVTHILFGASLTIATCFSAGRLLLQRLDAELYREEELLFSFVTGSACLGLLVFALAALGLARKGVFLISALVIIGAAIRQTVRRHRPAQRLPPLPRLWKWAFLLIFVSFAIFYFVNALAPETSPDGTAYHLSLVAQYDRHHGFPRITNNIFASLPQGMEMLFWFAFAFGRHSAASLVHFSFLLALPLAMVCYGRRFGIAGASVFGALLIFVSPIFGVNGTSAYNDVALACVLFCVFHLLQIWAETSQKGLLPAIGLLAGFAYAIKYTGFLAVPYALGFVAWSSWRKKGELWPRAIGPAALASLLMIAPWTVKNWIVVANPFSPFLNEVFPNPWVTIAFEKQLRAIFAHTNFSGPLQFARDVTLRGEIGGSIFGPAFLLAPLAVLALRCRQGRQLLIASALFALIARSNHDPRFLMPCAPFLALALGVAAIPTGIFAVVVVIASALASTPPALDKYSAPYVMRLRDFPLRQALRMESEDRWFASHLPEYKVAGMLERLVPPAGRVFSIGTPPRAYTSREVLVYWESASNLKLMDALSTAALPDLQPKWRLVFRFPARALRGIRLAQTGEIAKQDDMNPEMWSITELRILRAGGEIPRAAGWKVRAHPNPWDVDLAFDKNPVTRWRSQQLIYKGMYLAVEFPEPREIDAVSLDYTHDQWRVRLELEGEMSPGAWSKIAPGPESMDAPPLPDLRAQATAELKRRGITHLLAPDSGPHAPDFRRNVEAWRMALAGQEGEWRLYVLK